MTTLNLPSFLAVKVAVPFTPLSLISRIRAVTVVSAIAGPPMQTNNTDVAASTAQRQVLTTGTPHSSATLSQRDSIQTGGLHAFVTIATFGPHLVTCADLAGAGSGARRACNLTDVQEPSRGPKRTVSVVRLRVPAKVHEVDLHRVL
jgi:hypothetical protein